MNILNLCLSNSGIKYDTLPFLGERLPRKKLDFIWFSFLTSLAFIEASICFSDCDMCYLFHMKKFREFIKCSNVELICSACVKKKHFS